MYRNRMYRLKLTNFFTVVSLLFLLASCSKEGVNILGQEEPKSLVEGVQKSNNNQSVKLGIDLKLDFELFDEDISDKTDYDALRALSFAFKETTFRSRESNFQVLLILKNESKPELPYFYSILSLKNLDAMRTSFIYVSTCSKPMNLVWNGTKSFEEMKGDVWKAMLYTSDDLVEEQTKYLIGTKDNNKFYNDDSSIDLVDVNVPLWSDWQRVTILTHDAATGSRYHFQEPAEGLAYTMRLGICILKPQGVFSRVTFANATTSDVKVKGFRVETNAYNFKGTIDLSKAALEANNGIPKFTPISVRRGTNALGEECFVKDFAWANELTFSKYNNTDGPPASYFWMMPLEKPISGTKRYTQIYINASDSNESVGNTNSYVPIYYSEAENYIKEVDGKTKAKDGSLVIAELKIKQLK